MAEKEAFNKDLILREKLAIQRTVMANQTTLLSFIRTALYFMVAGLSIQSILKIEHPLWLELFFFSASFLVLVMGVVNYFRHRTRIRESAIHIGNYKLEYLQEIEL